jgi:protein gp37
MSGTTKIEWCHHTFNPVWGCVKISPECDHCYAEAWDKFTGGNHWTARAPLREFGDKHWSAPLKWDRAAALANERRRVFCASMADVFDNRWGPHIRERLWSLIQATPHLHWLLLTKRPENAAKMLPPDWRAGYANVWLGTTCGHPDSLHRIAKLRVLRARARFLSVEPLLAPLDLDLREIDWVMAGGESGAGARPCEAAWMRSIRDQCVAAGVKFFLKQWGKPQNNPLSAQCPPGEKVADFINRIDPHGKGGALIDGVLWREFPAMT